MVALIAKGLQAKLCMLIFGTWAHYKLQDGFDKMVLRYMDMCRPMGVCTYVDTGHLSAISMADQFHANMPHRHPIIVTTMLIKGAQAMVNASLLDSVKEEIVGTRDALSSHDIDEATCNAMEQSLGSGGPEERNAHNKTYVQRGQHPI